MGMSYRSTRIDENEFDESEGRLWFGMFGGAIAWLVHLLVAYGIAEFGCASAFSDVRWGNLSGVAWLEIAVSAVAFLTAVVASLVARRQRRVSYQYIYHNYERRDSPFAFLGRSGVIANVMFAFIIAVQSVPIFFYLSSC